MPITTKINLLPDFVANQIAAGEVVQRPESVVKELVENALDSGAKQIAVVVKNAGKRLVHVSDNGSGMSKDDLALSIKRHATSKIQSADDLEKILTYGFRGEALASISSVSQLEIRSKTEDDETGWSLTVEPSKSETIKPIAMDAGTQIFVNNLFYNVPARRKFLRTNMTEFRYISETMNKFALSRPEIGFVFYDDDSLIFHLKPESLEERIYKIVGKRSRERLIKIGLDNDLIKISGFVGDPHIAAKSRSNQYLFLNRRPIQSKSFSFAVFSAFEHMLEKNYHPMFLLNLEIDPEKVDVNVHPQKHEVKFDDERYVFNLISKAVQNALKSVDLTPRAISTGFGASSHFEKVPASPDAKEDYLLVNRETGEIVESKPPNFGGGRRESFSNKSRLEERRFDREFERRPDQSAIDGLLAPERKIDSEVDVRLENIEQKKIWTLYNKYVFIESGKGALVIDQHAAHERILYERALKAMNREYAYAQELLFPVALELNANQKSVLNEIKPDLRSLGFIVETSEGAITLKAVPGDVRGGDEEFVLKEILEVYGEYEQTRHSSKRDNLAASFSCKNAVKTGDSLSDEEIRALVENLFRCETPYVCPHGRPVFLEISLNDLDKQFKRI